MKLKLSIIFIPILLVAGYLLLNAFLPKYSGQYIFMLVLFFADLYLWSSITKKIFSNTIWLRVLIIAIYWLPLAMVIVIMLGSVFVPIIEWNDAFRTIWFGVIVVFYISKLIPVFFLLLADLLRLFNKIVHLTYKDNRKDIVRENNGMSRSKFLQYLGFVSGGLVMGTMFTGMFKWVYQFVVFKEKISINNLPSAFNGFKIVQISDMHLGSWTTEKPLIQAVEMINAMKADIVVFTGDLVNFSTREAYKYEDVLKNIEAKQGVFSILGNHDYGDYVNWPDKKSKEQNMTDLYSLYERMGWKLLNNENHVFDSGNGQLALIGVENWGANPRFPRKGDIDKALTGVEDVAAKILLSHDPSHWEKIILPDNYDIALTLAGHTHGFQFGYEGKNIKWSPAKWLYKYWAGLYSDKNTSRHLYVNRGIGSIGYPGRIGILPEITLIELDGIV
ncbi:MAG: metallophosphoesterase [Chlorobi bacterium]|nr:metallophosphoesterase [Chlorobiota bacterium]